MGRERERPDPRPTRHVVLRPGENIIDAITRAANEDEAARLDGEYLRWEHYRRLHTLFLVLLAAVVLLGVAGGALWRWYGGGWLGAVGVGAGVFMVGFLLLGFFLGEKVDGLRPGG